MIELVNVGVFDGVTIYYDKNSKDEVKRCRGPVDKTGTLPGLVLSTGELEK